MKSKLLIYAATISSMLAGTYNGGKGTTSNPYQIANTHDLIELSQTPTDWNKHFIQTEEIEFNESRKLVDWNLDGIIDEQDELGFSPIGNSDKKSGTFTGSFDGQLFLLKNLYINRESSDFVGLFGSTSKATIKNIRLRNSIITGRSKVGALIGTSKDDAIEKGINTGTVTGYDQTGGLIGYIENSIVNLCMANAQVSGNNSVGGLIGEATKSRTLISQSVTHGFVNGQDQVGGFIGNIDKVTITNVKTNTVVTGNYDVGGFAGIVNDSTLEQIFCKGETAGNSHVGAVVGHLEKKYSTTDIHYTEEKAPIGNSDLIPVPPATSRSIQYVNSTLDDEIIGKPPTDNNKYIESETVIIRGAETMYREGYIFWGWTPRTNTRKLKEKVIYTPGDLVVMPSSDLTLVSTWAAPPIITFENGENNVNLEIPINELGPIKITATDLDSPTLNYTITGGNDANLFKIEETDGTLEFITPPNYNQDGNNSYEVTVEVADELALTDTQTINYTLLNPTPVTGIDINISGSYLTIKVENEINVKEYQIYNQESDQLITVIKADNSGEYIVQLPENVEAVYVVIVDNSGFKQVYYSESDNKTAISYSLREGWNLIAMIGDDVNLTPLAKATTGEFWSWNGQDYELTSTPQATEGIWVYALKDTVVKLDVTKSSREIELNQGWNMVGPTDNTNSPNDADIIYSWDSIYQTILQDDILIQGVGYWVFSHK